MKWNTRFTKNFDCRLPLMGAPMAGTAGGELAYETCKAGGLGFISAGHLNSKQALKHLEQQIELFRELQNQSSSSSFIAATDSPKGVDETLGDNEEKHGFPLAIGFIGHSTFKNELGWNLVENILEVYQPEVVQFSFPAVSYRPDSLKDKISAPNIVKLCQSYGCKVMAQVGTVKEGRAALDAGVDCLIAQGSEAGGHGLRRELGSGTLSLTRALVQVAKERKRRVPVLAAGGIVDGSGLMAVLSLGADGAVLGTRLWASEEAMGPISFKEALVDTESCDDVVRTRVFDVVANSFRQTKWPPPFDSSSCLRNELTDAWDLIIPELEKELKNNGKDVLKTFQMAEKENHVEAAAVYSGQGVGGIHAIEPVADIVRRIEEEAAESLSTLQRIVVSE